MTDEEKAIEVITNFLRDDSKKILLVKGYDNYAKLKAVLVCLNQYFSKGIMRTSSMDMISDHIYRALNQKVLANNVKSTINYIIGRMLVNISSYATNTKTNPK